MAHLNDEVRKLTESGKVAKALAKDGIRQVVQLLNQAVETADETEGLVDMAASEGEDVNRHTVKTLNKLGSDIGRLAAVAKKIKL